jgi:dihydroflavonol-4-reductase
MTTVITGAAGFVGGNLIRALRQQDRDIRAVILNDGERERLRDQGVTMVVGDVRDGDSLVRAFDGADVVYHLASFISLQPDEWPLVQAINATGAQNVVNACRTTGVRRLVHFSSFHAYEQTPMDRPLDEDNPLIDRPNTAPYNRSKAQGEQIVRQAIAEGLDAVILSPTGIIGPNDFGPSYFGQTLIDISRGQMPVLIEGGCNWVDVRDVVAGAIHAEQHAPAGGRYLLSGHWATLRDIAALVREFTGIALPRVVPMAAARLYAPVHTAVCRLAGRTPRLTPVALEELSGNPQISHARASRDLAYAPRPLRDTIRDTLAFFADQGKLANIQP